MTNGHAVSILETDQMQKSVNEVVKKKNRVTIDNQYPCPFKEWISKIACTCMIQVAVSSATIKYLYIQMFLPSELLVKRLSGNEYLKAITIISSIIIPFSVIYAKFINFVYFIVSNFMPFFILENKNCIYILTIIILL